MCMKDEDFHRALFKVRLNRNHWTKKKKKLRNKQVKMGMQQQKKCNDE